jgi:hypothetical protein
MLKNSEAAKRRQQVVGAFGVAAGRLALFPLAFSRGLTPTAIFCRRFAASE